MYLRVSVNAGFALPTAIFVVVIVAGIVASMNRLASTQLSESIMQLQSTQAFWAAQTGLEWGMNTTANSASTPPACFANQTLNVGTFSVTVRCQRNDYKEASPTSNWFHFKVTAEAVTTGYSVDSPDYAWRSLQASQVINRP